MRLIHPISQLVRAQRRCIGQIRLLWLRRAGYIVVLVGGLGLVSLLFQGKDVAAWFNDAWQYRKLISFTHNANISAERRVEVSVDTATLISAGKMQDDCDDARFTDINGKLLRFELTGTCDNAATTFDVVFPEIIDGTNAAYVYYGNASALSASQDVSDVTSLSPSGGSPSTGSEEKGTSPVLYFNFDEGSGTTANDSSAQQNNGALNSVAGTTGQGDGRLWSSGFELNSATTGMEWEIAAGSPTIQGTTVRSGDYAMQITSLASGTRKFLSHGFNTVNNGPFYYRAYFRVATLPSAENRIITINNSVSAGTGVRVYITVDNTGALRLYDEDGAIGSASSALSTNTWYRIEIETDRTGSAGSHVVRARVDGTEFAGSSARDLSTGFLALHVGGNLNSESQTTGNWFFDDIAINNATGGYPGAGKIIHIRPNNTGDNGAWTNDYTAIDEVTPNDATDYILSNTLNQIEDVNLDNTPSGLQTDDIINNVAVGFRATSSSSGTNARFRVRIKASSGGTVEESTQFTNNTTSWYTNNQSTPKIYPLTLYDLPGASTTRWTKSDLDTTQIGVQLTVSDGSQEARMSAMWLLVDYTPSSDIVVSSPAPSWQPKDLCVSEKCLYFQGRNVSKDFVIDTPLDPGTDSFTVSAWFRNTSTLSGTETLVARYNGGGYKVYTSPSGFCFGIDNDGTSFPSDSACTTTTYADSKWHHMTAVKNGTSNIRLYIDGIKVAEDTSITASSLSGSSADFVVGDESVDGVNPWNGFIDEVKYYNFARSEAQIKADFAGPGTPEGASASFQPDNKWTSDGLVGYWKMDETAGNVSDYSGHEINLTNSGSTTFVGGKFGNGSEHVPASSQHFSTATTINGTQSISFWVNPDSTTNYYISLTSGAYVTSSAGTFSATGFDNPKIFVNGTETTTIAADSWQFVTVTTNTAINANQLYVGRQGSNYFDGTMDEVRLYNRTLTPSEVLKLYNWSPGPVGYWKMDENTGTTVNDSTIFNHSGTLSDANGWTQGKFGSAINFDGSSRFVGVNDADTLDLGTITDFTVSAWVTKDSTSTDKSIIMKGQEEGGSADGSWYLSYDSTNKIQMALTSDTWNNYCIIRSSKDIVDGNWHYITAVVLRNASCTTSDILIYIDGIKESTSVVLSNINTNVNLSNNDPLTIGAYYNLGTRASYWDGKIDGVKIYNYSRSAGQIIEDMNAGHPIGGSPVGSQVSYWSFDEMYGDTAYDTIGNNNGNLAGTGTTCPQLGDSACPTWTPHGKINGALNFDTSGTTDDYVFVPNSTSLNNLSEFSNSAWVNLESTGASQVFVNKSNALLYIDSSGVFNSFFGGSACSSSTTLSTGTWYHLAMTYDGTNVRLYVDGVLKATCARSATTGTADMYIGSDSTPSQFTDGIIDEVKFYSTALSEEQIKTDLNANAAINFGVGSSEEGSLIDGAGDPPIGWWKLDEKTGISTVNDSSGNNYTGTMNNFTLDSWRAGKYGSSLDFNGTNSFVNIPEPAGDPFDFGTTDSFSVSFWIKTTPKGDTQQPVFKGGDPGWRFRVSAVSGSMSLQIRDGTFSPSVENSGIQVDDGLWHHIVGVRDVETDTLFLYQDGILIATQNDTTTSSLANDTDLRFSFNGSSTAVLGQIDEVKIYNYARTSAQVAYDYNRGGPVGHWQLDECGGSNIYDVSGNDNHGTITIGGSGAQTSIGTCGLADTAWGNGSDGKRNTSLSFDGTDDHTSVADDAVLDVVDDLTLSFWLYLDPSANLPAVIISKDNGSDDSQAPYMIEISDSNQLFYWHHRTGGNWDDCCVALDSHTVPAGQWKHYTIVRKIATRTVEFYVDGVLVKQGIYGSGDGPEANATSLKFGRQDWSGNPKYFEGKLDDVRIYNYALSEAQVRSVRNNGAVYFGP